MSSAEILIFGKAVLTFGCLLGIPLWELYRLRRGGGVNSGTRRAAGGDERR